jgi:hypothetical protein
VAAVNEKKGLDINPATAAILAVYSDIGPQDI